MARHGKGAGLARYAMRTGQPGTQPLPIKIPVALIVCDEARIIGNV